ncbi:MAG: bifunctional 5,10-methylenetetrahydrofolate dehydrogenase/5,10-methenyltetrahydrofolate cyclohydrolase [Candidatus Eiseniibacteriota bacterium]
MDSDVRLLTGQPLAERVLSDVARRADHLRAHGVWPTLALVSVGDDPASRVYLARKQKEGERAGLNVRTAAFAADASPGAVLGAIDELASDRGVHGILLQMPLPAGWPSSDLQLAIPPSKDVDGFHPENLGRLAQGLPGFVACTPLGILGLLRHYEIPLAGRPVTIVGRSAIVGTPLALLLSRKGVDATVTVAHSRTPDLAAVCRTADVLVVAMGRPRAIGAAHVKRGATVIDVGIHRVPEAGDAARTRLVGDVDADPLRTVAGAISPVPGGVGPLTVAYLLSNTLDAAEQAARAAGVVVGEAHAKEVP